MKNFKGTLFLLITALIWGLAFVAQTTAAESIGPFTFNASRSILGGLFLLLLILLMNGVSKLKERVDNLPIKKNDEDSNKNKGKNLSNNKFKTESDSDNAGASNLSENKASDKCTIMASKKTGFKQLLLAGSICGALLCIMANFQQYGITLYPAGTASSGRAGFISATYVVMVAVYNFIKRKKLNIYIFISVIGCILGMYLLCLTKGFSNIYLGDILVFLCAVAFAVYILVVDKFSYFDSAKLSCVQFFVSAIISGICMFIFESPNITNILNAWVPIVYAGIFSSGIAYTLQMVGQKYAEPTIASIVMSLESVFAALFGFVILNEYLSTVELIGCIIVFASVILAQIPEFIKNKNEKKQQ